MNKPTKFITGMLAMALVFGMMAVGCDTGGGGGNDTWSQVTSVSQVVGTWKGSYTDTSSNFGNLPTGITAKSVIEMTYTIASTGTSTMSMTQTVTFSGANIDQAWPSIKAGFAGSGYSTNDSNHSLSATQSQPSGTITASDLNGVQINQSGTKVKMPAGSRGNGSPETILSRQ